MPALIGSRRSATLFKGGGYLFTTDVVILAAGQSNEQAATIVSQTIDEVTDQDGSGRILQWATSGGPAVAAVQPLTWPSGTQTAPSRSFAMAQAILPRVAPGKKIIIIPAAVGGTALYGDTWAAPSGSLYVSAKDALTDCLEAYPGAFVILSWTQGEQDANNLVTSSNYKSALSSMVAGFRSVSGAENMVVISHGLVPERYQVPPLDLPVRRTLMEAQQQLSVEIDRMHWIGSSLGSQIHATNDPSHFTAAGHRLAGQRAATAILGRYAEQFTSSAPAAPEALTAIGNGKVTFTVPSPPPPVYVFETRAAESADAWVEQIWYPPFYAAPGDTLTALVTGSGSIEIRLKARSRGGDSAATASVTQDAAWWHRDALIDVDDQNSRWMVNGTVHASKAAMVTAGVLSQGSGIDRYAIGSFLTAWFTFAAKGLTPGTTVGSTPRYLAALDDGADGSAADELIYFAEVLNVATQELQATIFSSSSQQATGGATVSNSATVRGAMRCRANDVVLSITGGTMAYDAVVTVPAVSQLVVGNRDDGARPWTGTFYRATVIASPMTGAEIQSLLS